MSRLKKRNIFFKEVKVTLVDNICIISGPLGTLKQKINRLVKLLIKENLLELELVNNIKKSNMILGTTYSLVLNMIYGVTIGFKKKLVLFGIGYRASVEDNKLNLFIGFSHKIIYKILHNIKINTPTPTEIIVSGIDKQLVGQVASEIRKCRTPDIYKGKGIRYFNEKVLLKETKKK